MNRIECKPPRDRKQYDPILSVGQRNAIRLHDLEVGVAADTPCALIAPAIGLRVAGVIAEHEGELVAEIHLSPAESLIQRPVAFKIEAVINGACNMLGRGTLHCE